MGLSSTTNRVVLAGNGSSAVFNFPYYFFAQTDLDVYTYDTVISSSILQVLNTNYTISGTQNAQGLYTSGANIVMNSSPNATTNVIIIRNPPRVQNYSLQQNGTISSAATVQELDYLTMLIQRMEDKASRSIRLPDGYGSSFSTILPINLNLSPNGAIVINSSGTGLTTGSTPVFAGTAGYVLTGNGGSSAATFQAISLSGSGVTGTLSLSNGGTGGLTPQTWGVVFASSATQLATTDPFPVGLPLISQASSGPKFQQLNFAAAGSGFLPLLNVTPGSSAQVIVTSSGVAAWASIPAGSGVALIGNNLSDMASASTSFKNISPLTTVGDIIIYGSNALQVRLPAGSADQVLVANGAAQPSWQSRNYGSSALLIANNLSDVASKPAAITNISPTTTWGDVMYAGSGNVITRLAASTTGNVLSTNGAGAAPSWIAVATGSSLTNPMTTPGDMIYGGSSGVATRLVGSVSSSSAILMITGSGGFSAAPAWTPVKMGETIQTFTVVGSSTYTTPVGVKWIKVRAVAAGGGGGGSGTSGSTGVTGGTMFFGSSVLAQALVCNGGTGGPGQSGGYAGGGPGGAIGGDINLAGGYGINTIGNTATAVNGNYGANGGNSMFLGGAPGGANGAGAGVAAGANTGGGGGGAGGSATMTAAPGGGAGGYLEKTIINPAATYAVSLPDGGVGGGAGTSGGSGGKGGSGFVIVEEHYI